MVRGSEIGGQGCGGESQNDRNGRTVAQFHEAADPSRTADVQDGHGGDLQIVKMHNLFVRDFLVEFRGLWASGLRPSADPPSAVSAYGRKSGKPVEL